MTGIYLVKLLYVFIFFAYFLAVTDADISHLNKILQKQLQKLRSFPTRFNQVSDVSFPTITSVDPQAETSPTVTPPTETPPTETPQTVPPAVRTVAPNLYFRDLKKSTNYKSTTRGLLNNTIGKIHNFKPLEIIKNARTLDLNELIPVVTPEDEKEYLEGVKSGDQFRNVTQLLEKYGFRTETHYVQTEDGYILTVFRIPSNGPPVFVEHGLLSSSDDFVTLGPEKALAYLLSNEGYDVWLGNARGNKHSQKHVSLTTDDDEYWDFSFDEIGRYDHPATIDYILKTTGYTQLYWVGHSQGTTSFFILCAERPEYNDKVAFMVALSAVAYMGHTTSIGFKTLSPVFQYYNISKLLVGPAIPSNNFIKLLKKILCEGNIYENLICQNVFFLLFGFMNSKTDYKALPVIASHSPSSISTKQFSHYADLVESGKFIKFDYKDRNEDVYGSKTPPEYEVEKITVPMAIFQGPADWITVDQDLNLLTNRLKNDYKVYRVPDDEFGHLDFLFSKDVVELLYRDVINVLKSAVNN